VVQVGQWPSLVDVLVNLCYLSGGLDNEGKIISAWRNFGVPWASSIIYVVYDGVS